MPLATMRRPDSCALDFITGTTARTKLPYGKPAFPSATFHKFKFMPASHGMLEGKLVERHMQLEHQLE